MESIQSILGRSAFPGPVIEIGRSGATFAGEAAFEGCFAITEWRRADVERLLPPEIALAENVSSRAARHPVVFAFGEQKRGAWIWGGLTLPVGLEYHELMIAIPFVVHRSGRFLHTYIPRMYASNSPAVWDGNARYGLAKELADLGWWNTTFVVTDARGRLVLHADVEADGAWRRAASAPAARAAAEIFALPVLGRKASGQYVSSYFAWDFDAATARPAAAAISLDAPLVAGLEPRVIQAADGRAVSVQDLRWRLSWPVACRF